MTLPASALDLLLTNGKVYTVNSAQPWVEAIGVEDGSIRFLGNSEQAQALSDQAERVIDLNGHLVLPGLHDVHMHPLEAGNPAAAACSLRIGMNPEREIGNLRRCAKYQLGAGWASDWVLGWGYSIFDVLSTDRPPVEILDQAIPDQPALMMDFTSHSMWANSLALQAAGIDTHTQDPVGGVIVKDLETGQPNGILVDNAGNMVMEYAFAPTEKGLNLAYQGVLKMLPRLAGNGLTSIVDARSYWTRKHHEVWQKLADENRLTARVVLSLWAYPDKDESQIEILKKLYRNDPDSLLRMSQIKVYMDGVVDNTTAAMKTPYLEDLGWVAGNRGLNYFDEARLTRYIEELGSAGFDFNIHAIGDRAVHEALNAIESADRINGQINGQIDGKTNGENNDRRHRLTHLEIVDDIDIPRFKALNVIADFQVAGDGSFPEVYSEAETLIGEKAHNPIPIRSIHDSGAVVTLSSDFDVSTMNPFVAMQHALTRGAESLETISDVIEAYTINGAYLMRHEDKTGSIELGKFADLVVVDQNLFEISVESISDTKVLLTLLAGKEVYRSPEFSRIQ